MEEPLYRPNVCAAIQKGGTNQLLMCHRIGYSADTGWQFPQGGIDIGADLVSEMRRELREEIGTDNIKVVTISPFYYTYTLPSGQPNRYPKYQGQIQRWIHAEFSDDDSTLNFSCEPAEFDAFTWMCPSVVLQHIIDFKYDVYFSALGDLGFLAQ